MAAQGKFSFTLVLCSRQIPAKANKLILSYLILSYLRYEYLVDKKMCLIGSSLSCLHTCPYLCIQFALYSPRLGETAQVPCVIYQGR